MIPKLKAQLQTTHPNTRNFCKPHPSQARPGKGRSRGRGLTNVCVQSVCMHKKFDHAIKLKTTPIHHHGHITNCLVSGHNKAQILGGV